MPNTLQSLPDYIDNYYFFDERELINANKYNTIFIPNKDFSGTIEVIYNVRDTMMEFLKGLSTILKLTREDGDHLSMKLI